MENSDTDVIYSLLDSLHEKIDVLERELVQSRKLNTIAIICTSLIGLITIILLGLLHYDSYTRQIDDISTVASFRDSARIHANELQDIHNILEKQRIRQDILELNYKIDKKSKANK